MVRNIDGGDATAGVTAAQVSVTGAVSSVAGKTGDVRLTQADVAGLPDALARKADQGSVVTSINGQTGDVTVVTSVNGQTGDVTVDGSGAGAVTSVAAKTGDVVLVINDITGLVTSLSGKVGSGDIRLTNARTPTAHAASHGPHGSDPIDLSSIGGADTSQPWPLATRAMNVEPQIVRAVLNGSGSGGMATAILGHDQPPASAATAKMFVLIDPFTVVTLPSRSPGGIPFLVGELPAAAWADPVVPFAASAPFSYANTFQHSISLHFIQDSVGGRQVQIVPPPAGAPAIDTTPYHVTVMHLTRALGSGGWVCTSSYSGLPELMPLSANTPSTAVDGFYLRGTQQAVIDKLTTSLAWLPSAIRTFLRAKNLGIYISDSASLRGNVPSAVNVVNTCQWVPGFTDFQSFVLGVSSYSSGCWSSLELGNNRYDQAPTGSTAADYTNIISNWVPLQTTYNALRATSQNAGGLGGSSSNVGYTPWHELAHVTDFGYVDPTTSKVPNGTKVLDSTGAAVNVLSSSADFAAIIAMVAQDGTTYAKTNQYECFAEVISSLWWYRKNGDIYPLLTVTHGHQKVQNNQASSAGANQIIAFGDKYGL